MAMPLPLWLRALWEPKDLTQSRKLVQELHLPPSTSQFVYALRPSDAPDSVVYILSSLPLSERSATDARKVIEAAHPKAVVSLVDLRAIESFKEEEKLAGEPFSVPSSTLGVIQEHLERDPDVVPYASRARAQVSRSIFGTGMFSDVLEAKAAASEADASFHYIDFPYRIDAEYGGDDLAMAGIRNQDDGIGVTGDVKVIGHF
jgi:hypothetical protein